MRDKEEYEIGEKTTSSPKEATICALCLFTPLKSIHVYMQKQLSRSLFLSFGRVVFILYVLEFLLNSLLLSSHFGIKSNSVRVIVLCFKISLFSKLCFYHEYISIVELLNGIMEVIIWQYNQIINDNSLCNKISMS